MLLRKPPRRFGRCLEFDRAGDARSGTPEQQARIREEIKQFVQFNNRLDKVLAAVDKVAYKRGVYYINITFGTGFIGFANPNGFYLNYGFSPDLTAVYFWHELGHVVGMNVFNPQDRTEEWAEEFRIWVANGSPDDATWAKMRPVVEAILLP